MINNIWVVETFYDGKWQPTVGVKFTRKDIRIKQAEWKKANPDDRFRIRQYFSEEDYR